MSREQNINRILQGGPDETRRLALDQIDATARSTNTWGTSEHRKAREKVEQAYTDERNALEKLSDEQLDRAIARQQV